MWAVRVTCWTSQSPNLHHDRKLRADASCSELVPERRHFGKPLSPHPAWLLMPHCSVPSSLLHFTLHSSTSAPASFLSTPTLNCLKILLLPSHKGCVTPSHPTTTSPLPHLSPAPNSSLTTLEKTQPQENGWGQCGNWKAATRSRIYRLRNDKQIQTKSDHLVGSEKHTVPHYYPGALLMALCSRRQGQKFLFTGYLESLPGDSRSVGRVGFWKLDILIIMTGCQMTSNTVFVLCSLMTKEMSLWLFAAIYSKHVSPIP